MAVYDSLMGITTVPNLSRSERGSSAYHNSSRDLRRDFEIFNRAPSWRALLLRQAYRRNGVLVNSPREVVLARPWPSSGDPPEAGSW